jgi:hypothetical protein
MLMKNVQNNSINITISRYQKLCTKNKWFVYSHAALQRNSVLILIFLNIYWNLLTLAPNDTYLSHFSHSEY